MYFLSYSFLSMCFSYTVFVIVMQFLPGVVAAIMAGAYFTSVSARQCKLIFCSFELYSLVDRICAFYLNTFTFSAQRVHGMVMYI